MRCRIRQFVGPCAAQNDVTLEIDAAGREAVLRFTRESGETVEHELDLGPIERVF